MTLKSENAQVLITLHQIVLKFINKTEKSLERAAQTEQKKLRYKQTKIFKIKKQSKI